MRRYLIVGSLGIALTAFAANHSLASIIIGPGTTIIPGTSTVDTPGTVTASGTRTNVDLSFSQVLPAGTYQATTFDFNAGQLGDVQPFLAVVSGTSGGHNIYQLIAAGTDNTVSATGLESVPFGGSSTFTVPVGGETVYGGIENVNNLVGGGNPVYVTLNANTDDHEAPGYSGPFTTATTFGPVNNPGIGRDHAFDVVVNPVPEPSSLALVAIGTAGLFWGVRRRLKG